MAVTGMAARLPPFHIGRLVVPIHRLLQNCAFDQEAINVMVSAFEGACRALDLVDGHPRREYVAKAVIELAQQGERDAERLRERTIEFVRAT
jgi:hypothetical protein